MKKMILILVAMFVLVPFFSAFAEEMVALDVPATSLYDAAKLPPSSNKGKAVAVTHKTIKKGPSEISKLSSRINALSLKTGKLVTATQTNADNVGNLSKNVGDVVTSVDSNTDAVNNIGGKVDKMSNKLSAFIKSLKGHVTGEADALSNQGVANTWIICAISIFMGILIILAVWLLSRRNRDSITNVAQSTVINENINEVDRTVNNIHDAVVEKSDLILDAIQSLKANVNGRSDVLEEKIDRIEEAVLFNSSPINVTAAGHCGVFTQSAEALSREVYQYVDVDEDVDASVTADTYELPTTSNRNFAHDKNRQAIREYHNGSLKKKADAGSNAAKLKIAIIEYLRDVTKQLTIKAL